MSRYKKCQSLHCGREWVRVCTCVWEGDRERETSCMSWQDFASRDWHQETLVPCSMLLSSAKGSTFGKYKEREREREKQTADSSSDVRTTAARTSIMSAQKSTWNRKWEVMCECVKKGLIIFLSRFGRCENFLYLDGPTTQPNFATEIFSVDDCPSEKLHTVCV